MVKILRNCDPMADCKPVVFMSCFLLIFWLLLSYVTNSYFAIFLMVSNFILIFGCCVSLSGYVVGQLIDNRREAGQLIEVTTISSSQPFVRPPEYPPSYDEAIRFGLQHCRNQNGGDGVVLCIPLENDSRMNPIYVPYGAPVENSHRPIPFSNGIPNIPSYDMISSSAVVSASSITPSTEVPRSTAVSDFERSATHTEPYPTIQTLNQLPESRTMNTNTVSTVIPEDSQTLTLSRSNTVCEIDSNLELSGTASSTSSQISRVGVSDSCRDTNSSSKKEAETQVQCEKDWKACGTLPTTSQDLEFRRISSSLPDRHSSLSRSLSFPGIK